MEVTWDPEPPSGASGVLAAALAGVQARLEAQQAQLAAQHQLLQGLAETLRTHWAPQAPAPGGLGCGPDAAVVAPARTPIIPEPDPTGATESSGPAGPTPTPAPMAALPCRPTQPPQQQATPPTPAPRRADLAASWRRSPASGVPMIPPAPHKGPPPLEAAPGRSGHPILGQHTVLDSALAGVTADRQALSSPTPRAGVGHPNRSSPAVDRPHRDDPAEGARQHWWRQPGATWVRAESRIPPISAAGGRQLQPPSTFDGAAGPSSSRGPQSRDRPALAPTVQRSTPTCPACTSSRPQPLLEPHSPLPAARAPEDGPHAVSSPPSPSTRPTVPAAQLGAAAHATGRKGAVWSEQPTALGSGPLSTAPPDGDLSPGPPDGSQRVLGPPEPYPQRAGGAGPHCRPAPRRRRIASTPAQAPIPAPQPPLGPPACPPQPPLLDELQLRRLQESEDADRKGRKLPPCPAQDRPWLQRLTAGYKDALEDVLRQPVAAAEVNGRAVEPASQWTAAHPLLSPGAPRHVLLSLFGLHTADLPSPEEADPLPVARAFIQAVLQQYDAFREPSTRRPGTKRPAPSALEEDPVTVTPAAPATRRRQAPVAQQEPEHGGAPT